MSAREIINARNPQWPLQFSDKFGVVFVATGRRFLDEAREATAQLKSTNPNLPVCVITDHSDYRPIFWDDLVVVAQPFFGFRDKILMGLCPYERFLFLDTDTFVTGDIAEVFELLKRFDFVGHQLFDGYDCPVPGIPHAFPEINSGVIGFRRANIRDFFSQWLKNYDEFYALNRDGFYHFSNSGDQKSLRKTIYFSDLRIAILGPEYNFIPIHVNFACAKVRIIHGRGKDKLLDLDRRINRKFGNRAYIPRLDVVIHNDLYPAELVRLYVMCTLQLIRFVGKIVTPLALRNQLRKSSYIRAFFLRARFCEASTKKDPKWHEP